MTWGTWTTRATSSCSRNFLSSHPPTGSLTKPSLTWPHEIYCVSDQLQCKKQPSLSTCAPYHHPLSHLPLATMNCCRIFWVTIVCPVVHTAAAFSKYSSSVYLYQFSHRTSANPWPTWMGVLHGYELDHVFGAPLASSGTHKYDSWEKELSSKMIAYWTNFAKTGYFLLCTQIIYCRLLT